MFCCVLAGLFVVLLRVDCCMWFVFVWFEFRCVLFVVGCWLLVVLLCRVCLSWLLFVGCCLLRVVCVCLGVWFVACGSLSRVVWCLLCCCLLVCVLCFVCVFCVCVLLIVYCCVCIDLCLVLVMYLVFIVLCVLICS